MTRSNEVPAFDQLCSQASNPHIQMTGETAYLALVIVNYEKHLVLFQEVVEETVD